MDFSFKTRFRGMNVEVEALTEASNFGRRRFVTEKHLYLERDGRKADWLLSNASLRQEAELDREIVEVSFG
jgi:hypothetical protein